MGSLIIWLTVEKERKRGDVMRLTIIMVALPYGWGCAKAAQMNSFDTWKHARVLFDCCLILTFILDFTLT